MPQPLRPLLVTADGDLLDDLLRLAAAADSEADVAADPAAARLRFPSAPIVLIGADLAVACARARLPRRSRVIVVLRGSPPEGLWPTAESLGAEHVAALPEAEPWLIEQLATRPRPPAVSRTLAVIGGRGGAGASILAAGLAGTAVAAGRRTLLIDADPLGGGLDLVLGWEQVSGLRWPGLAGAGGRVDPPALLNALPHRGDLVLLSFDRDQMTGVPAEAMAATLDAARRGRDVIVADLPRQLDDAAALALQAADRTLLVVPAELRATAAAARTLAQIRPHCEQVSVVVRGPAPGRLRPRDIAQTLGLPLAGALRPDPAMCQDLERGTAPATSGKGPLAELCRRLVDELMRPPAVAA
ncbi:Septum site-determining protein minD [Actinoplanes sp. SE50]|uniref:septum site-determining protein Ssd n=1 Tax=unclassified Actinoplanes TaxID=2626549 RepID=UPI00023EC3BC|nr:MULTISPECIES: septum site-determining protein Ssd [unclassified Actinoplanes]AEV81375.1 Septum site-determining protein minD [Actinoplanes sp. SE50/110]ATO79778.1 Septum site-determining protein minD [Actinoplanes sp. SE50]SLL97180.1 septum site-determining protein MinD [Actinoplanes sp. SE50/110]